MNYLPLKENGGLADTVGALRRGGGAVCWAASMCLYLSGRLVKTHYSLFTAQQISPRTPWRVVTILTLLSLFMWVPPPLPQELIIVQGLHTAPGRMEWGATQAKSLKPSMEQLYQSSTPITELHSPIQAPPPPVPPGSALIMTAPAACAPIPAHFTAELLSASAPLYLH